MHALLLAALLLPFVRQAPTAVTAAPAQQPATLALPRAAHEGKAPSERCEVVRVVDGDTIHVQRAGKLEKLRLLCVDTEERLGTGFSASESKPETVFGEECALWAQGLVAGLADKDGKTRVGLLFPGGKEQYDPFGRLLCHVILPDGTDFNLELVRRGKSPYFNKYGDSELCHAELVAAQRAAREGGIGIWDPAANQPRTSGAPAAKRPYERLLPWWDARAEAIQGFRLAHAADAAHVLACEDLPALTAAAGERREVRVFGEIEQIFDETSGDLTVLFRSPDRERALRVRIPKAVAAAHAALDLEATREDYRQNYVYVSGKLAPDRDGFALVSQSPEQWKLAGPEPEVAAEPAKVLEAAGSAR